MRNPKIYKKFMINTILFIVAILLMIFVLPKVVVFFMPFVIGWVLALMANPLVRFMDNKIKIRRKHSSSIITIGVLAIVILLLYLIGVFLFRQCVNLFTDIPNIYNSMERQIKLASGNLDGLYKIMPEEAKSVVDNLSLNLDTYLSKFVSGIKMPTISDAGNMVKNVADLFFMTIITILSAYFFIAERDNITNKIRTITPKSVLEKYDLIVNNFKRAVGGYFLAQFKIMLILIVIMVIGFEILDVGYSVLLAIGIALLDFLPVFGTGAVFWPWALIDLISGNYVRAIGLMVIYLLCLVIKQILQPKIVGDSIGLNPLMTLIFMFIGYRVQGLIGMIIGIPAGMVLINLYRSGLFDGIISNIKLIASDINEYRK